MNKPRKPKKGTKRINYETREKFEKDCSAKFGIKLKDGRLVTTVRLEPSITGQAGAKFGEGVEYPVGPVPKASMKIGPPRGSTALAGKSAL